MPTTSKKKKSPGIGDEAVQAKTGKSWAQWFALLDKAGGRKLSHKEIVAFLSAKHRVGPWWRQMVTVEYERSRGLREKHQTATGYSLSRSRTLNADVKKIFAAWQDARIRSRWLGEKNLTLRTVNANKSIRMLWKDAKTEVNVSFYPRGDKTQVVVEHNKLANAATVKRMQDYWAGKLEKLQEIV